jgi:hypothetical protein
VIAVELAVTGALLFQIRYFAPRGTEQEDQRDLPDPRLRLAFAVILGATLFGSLAAMLRREARMHEPRWDVAVTIVGASLYVALVVGVLILVAAG